MIGQLLLRLVYKYVPKSFYDYPRSLVKDEPMVLDVGGGSGGLLHGMDCKGYHVVWELDPILASRAPRGPCSEAVIGDAENLGIRNKSWFGAIVFHDSLHHFTNPCKASEEADRVLANGCIHIHDFQPKGLGKLLEIGEQLLGFPAKFLKIEDLSQVLSSKRYKVVEQRRGKVGYTIIACRRTRTVR